jgi:osmoprotectant transport system permease protein
LSFDEYVRNRWERLFSLGIEHSVIVSEAVAIAALIDVCLGLLTYRTNRPRELVLAVSGVFLTIPSLALFGLFISPFVSAPNRCLLPLSCTRCCRLFANTLVGLREVDLAII